MSRRDRTLVPHPRRAARPRAIVLNRMQLFVGTVAVVALSPVSVRAQTAGGEQPTPTAHTASIPGPRRGYRIHPAGDGAAITLAAATWLVPQFFLSRLIIPRCPCSADGLIPLDRFAAGRRDDGIARAADVSVGLAIALPFLFDALDVGRTRGRWTEFLEDFVVIGESFVISGALNQAVKIGLHRPRPMLYGLSEGDPLLSVPDNYLSFYSAHTSTAFAIGVSYVYTFAQRHPHSPARYALGAVAVLAGGSIATMRVLSGRHFPTDVLVGALAGTLVGLTVPWLHSHDIPMALAVYPSPDGVVIGVAGTMN